MTVYPKLLSSLNQGLFNIACIQYCEDSVRYLNEISMQITFTLIMRMPSKHSSACIIHLIEIILIEVFITICDFKDSLHDEFIKVELPRYLFNDLHLILSS